MGKDHELGLCVCSLFKFEKVIFSTLIKAASRSLVWSGMRVLRIMVLRRLY